jgi:hypothetical protein
MARLEVGSKTEGLKARSRSLDAGNCFPAAPHRILQAVLRGDLHQVADLRGAGDQHDIVRPAAISRMACRAAQNSRHAH